MTRFLLNWISSPPFFSSLFQCFACSSTSYHTIGWPVIPDTRQSRSWSEQPLRCAWKVAALVFVGLAMAERNGHKETAAKMKAAVNSVKSAPCVVHSFILGLGFLVLVLSLQWSCFNRGATSSSAQPLPRFHHHHSGFQATSNHASMALQEVDENLDIKAWCRGYVSSCHALLCSVNIDLPVYIILLNLLLLLPRQRIFLAFPSRSTFCFPSRSVSRQPQCLLPAPPYMLELLWRVSTLAHNYSII